MFERMQSRVETITPRKADALLRLNVFEGQRPLSQPTVQAYARAMKTGEFRRGEIGLAKKSFNGGHEVLVNGQHQLHACVQSSVPFCATVDYYKCQQPNDLWKLFGTFDGHRRRTDQHIMKAARGLFESKDLQTVPLRVLNMCGSALVYLGGGIKPNFVAEGGRNRKPDLVQHYFADVMTVASYFDDNTKAVITIPIVTAIMATHRVDPKHAPEFWERVLHGDNLVRNSPQYKLHHKLNQPHRGVVRIGGRSALQAQQLYSLCVTWWNSWKTGEARSSVKLASMKTTPDIVK